MINLIACSLSILGPTILLLLARWPVVTVVIDWDLDVVGVPIPDALVEPISACRLLRHRFKVPESIQYGQSTD